MARDGRLASAYDRFLAWLAAAGAVILFAMVAGVTAEVVMRSTINRTIPGIIDLTEIGIYAMTVLIAPWLLGQGQHIRMEFMLTMIPRRVAWACELIGDCVGILVCLFLTWYGFKATFLSLTQNYVIFKSLTYPEWWILAPMPVAFLLLTVEFVRRLVRLLRGDKAPRAETTSVA
jgi:TRAP-type C4-dicarboxylate transport system permease small subunit